MHQRNNRSPSPQKKKIPTFWFLGLDSFVSLTGLAIADLVLGGDGEEVSHPLLQTGDLVDSVVRLDVLHLHPLLAGLLAPLHAVTGDLGSTILCGWLPFQGDVIRSQARSCQIARRPGWHCEVRIQVGKVGGTVKSEYR